MLNFGTVFSLNSNMFSCVILMVQMFRKKINNSSRHFPITPMVAAIVTTLLTFKKVKLPVKTTIIAANVRLIAQRRFIRITIMTILSTFADKYLNSFHYFFFFNAHRFTLIYFFFKIICSPFPLLEFVVVVVQ